ncbi:hypothetical protein [Granulicella rosea]|uniref:hypothetical protein n=1 Tax=Granulicella rosea TaxID=474952 RepID=UPI000B77FC18|nr:hypothetical protein [Granulicella rosea]
MAKHLAVAGIVTAFLLKYLTDEAKAWLPWCARRFFDVSICLLPQSERERYSEEWCTHLLSFPGTGFASLQFIWAALSIRALILREELVTMWSQLRLLAVTYRVLSYCWLRMKISRIFGGATIGARDGSSVDANVIGVLIFLILALAWCKQSERQQIAAA